jgi:hypothetical protein
MYILERDKLELLEFDTPYHSERYQTHRLFAGEGARATLEGFELKAKS